MHEYEVTKNIVDICTDEAKKSDAEGVTKITLVIGELSSYADESVRMYFKLMSKGTILENAALVFKRQPIELQCKSCGQKFHKIDNSFECPICQESGVVTGNSGHEFYIESMEIQENSLR